MIISDDLYEQIRRIMPIPCVDLLISDRSGCILLVKRKNEPAKGEWWFPGGRIHFKETRAMAAERKLRQECNLEALSITNAGTYDVILDLPVGKLPSHGITTVFHVRVRSRDPLKLDEQSSAADWHPLQVWLEKNLHSFVRERLLFYMKSTSFQQ